MALTVKELKRALEDAFKMRTLALETSVNSG